MWFREGVGQVTETAEGIYGDKQSIYTYFTYLHTPLYSRMTYFI